MSGVESEEFVGVVVWVKSSRPSSVGRVPLGKKTAGCDNLGAGWVPIGVMWIVTLGGAYGTYQCRVVLFTGWGVDSRDLVGSRLGW